MFNILTLSDLKSRALLKNGWVSIFQPFFFPTNEFYPYLHTDEDPLDESLSRAIKILNSVVIYKLISILVLSLIFYIIEKNLKLITNEYFIINKYLIPIINNWEHQSGVKVHLAVIGFGLGYIFYTFCTVSRLYFSLAIALGINIPDTINSPWKSKNFKDFFSRIMFYYNLILTRFFYYPMLNIFKISKINNLFIKKISNNIILFLAIYVGGFVLHLSYNIDKITRFGTYGLINYTYTKYSFYLLALSSTLAFLNFKILAIFIKNNMIRSFLYLYFFILLFPLALIGDKLGASKIILFYMKIFSIFFYYN